MDGGVYVTYLPLGSMTVEAGLGGAVTPALSVVTVKVKLKVDHLSVKLDESVWLAIHGRRGEGCCRKGGWVPLGMG